MNERRKGYSLIFVAGSLWGLIGLFVTILDGMGIEAFNIAFLRTFFGSIFFVIVVILLNGIKGLIPNKTELVLAVSMGLVCQTLFNISYTVAIKTIGVATGAVLLYTSPMFVAVLSRIIFKEKVTKIKVIALLVNILGCLLTVTNGNFNALEFSIIGIAMGVLAGFLYATLTIFGKIAGNKKCNVATISLYSFVTATIILFFVGNPLGQIELLSKPKVILTAIGYGLIPTAMSYYLYMLGLSKPVEASKVPVIASVETVIAALIGVIVFSELFGIYKFIGIALVMFSVGLISLDRRNDVK